MSGVECDMHACIIYNNWYCFYSYGVLNSKKLFIHECIILCLSRCIIQNQNIYCPSIGLQGNLSYGAQ